MLITDQVAIAPCTDCLQVRNEILTALLRTIPGIVLIGLLAVSVMGQQKKIPKEPLHVVDASTGKLIPELLLLPRYSSFTGTSTLLGEGPGGGSYRDYLAKPFVYHTGDPFVIKLPKSTGFTLPGLLFMGKGRSLDGVAIGSSGLSSSVVHKLVVSRF